MKRFRLMPGSLLKTVTLLASSLAVLIPVLMFFPPSLASAAENDGGKAKEGEGPKAIKRKHGSAPAPASEIRTGDLYAVVVGVSRYRNRDIRRLNLSAKDAKDFGKFLKTQKKLEEIASLSRPSEPVDFARSAIKEDEWALSYDVTDPGVVAYLTRGKRLVKSLFKPVKRKELDELVRTFREPLDVKTGRSLKKKLTAFDFAAGKKLSDLLLTDILPDLPQGTPVIVIPDDPLGVIPFEMLVLKAGGIIETDKRIPYVSGTAFFGDRNPISYYQSFTALTTARTGRTQRKGGDRLLVIADPVFRMRDPRAQNPRRRKIGPGHLPQDLMWRPDSQDRKVSLAVAMEQDTSRYSFSFSRLAGTGELAQSLAGMYQGRTDIYTGLDAGKENFLSRIAPKLSQYDKVVIATHIISSTDLLGVREQSIVLSLVPPGTDGFLRTSEVAGLKMNADIVVLCGGEGALGGSHAGEIDISLAEAFQIAGSRSVLAALWHVVQRPSVRLVESFFKHVKEGKSKVQALKLARERIRSEGYDHPFFWAAFILQGEAE